MKQKVTSCQLYNIVYNRFIMVIRMRHTRAHTANRRSHHGLDAARLTKCVNCGAFHLRHRACSTCGQYRGRNVLNVTAKIEKRAKKRDERAKAASAK